MNNKDDSGHRKSGIFSDGVGRQYIGEIGKIENGLVAVTTHLYDGKKSVPLDVELYQPASSLPEGKKNPEFKKKWEIALALIDRSRERGEHPSIILTDAGYGNNSSFIKQLEPRKLKYLVAVAKNREMATAQWIVETYGQRNWVEVFYRDAKSWLGWREAQVRDKKKLLRHFILVFCAYSKSI